MLTATFIFRPGERDDEFEALTLALSERARCIEGFVDEEEWCSLDSETRLVNYYWRDRESLDRFVTDRIHRYAKSRQKQWYDGHHVIISEVVSTYGDGGIPHATGRSRYPKGKLP
ncbi:antibiotic biosynthesis monooxygenase family protein [Qipengyuania sp.]|uniref:antibiotic biosynthesis monooxygenase family protein n=1 Tax=Qipengyuania sp. TaxID=2004515 RepID=UPI003BAB5105